MTALVEAEAVPELVARLGLQEDELFTPPAGVGVLGDDEVAVGCDLDDRISRILESANRAPVLEAVSSGTLGAAFDDVAGHGPGRA